MGRMVSTKADILCCCKDPALPRPILCACQVCTLKFYLSVKKKEMFRILQFGQFGPTAEVELSWPIAMGWRLSCVICYIFFFELLGQSWPNLVWSICRGRRTENVNFKTLHPKGINFGVKTVKLMQIFSTLRYIYTVMISVEASTKGGSKTGMPPPPFFEKITGFVFVNLDYITRIYFNFSQHTMFTICILLTTLYAMDSSALNEPDDKYLW